MKHNNITIGIIVSFVLLLFQGCKKIDPIRYSEKDGLAFYVYMQSETDSTTYSFSNQIGDLKQDTLWVKMRVTGKVRDYDRKVELKAVDSLSSAVIGEDYELPPFTLPADSFSFRYPVILIKTDKLKEESLTLGLEVKENDDFVQGATGIANVSTSNERYYKIFFNDQIIKPYYWQYIQPYFGRYSAVKYKFMIEVLKISDFRPEAPLGGTISYGDFLNFRSKMQKELELLNKKNGYKLVDEFGEEVVF